MNTDLATLIDRLNSSRPDLLTRYEHTGGGIFCIVVETAGHVDDVDADIIYIGTGSGNLGWSDMYGEAHGEWEELTGGDPADAVNGRLDLATGAILAMLAVQFPPAA